MPERILVFDMDGVLVDVSESYRETICRTVEHFTGRRITRALIQTYKNQGGWNNDWALSQKITGDLGVEVDYDTVVERFQKFFLGDGDGLILRERWIPKPGLLERLGRRYQLAIFTGRIREELDITLSRFAPDNPFDPIICTRDVARGKPAPDGLRKIADLHPESELCYVGDTVDDARSASAAGVAFIGIADPANPRYQELAALFQAEKAVAILGDVNQLEAALGI
jgi:HAD superfamily phosphatase